MQQSTSPQSPKQNVFGMIFNEEHLRENFYLLFVFPKCNT